ncbi:MAG: hypothetical protein JOZ51_13785 [Chloroflexi bacterium]|nr:hypothetical protein [Chloroflexota bacterium]
MQVPKPIAHSEPLFEPIERQTLPYCTDVEPIERLMVRIAADGKIVIKGQRSEIEALIRLLDQQGIAGKLNYLSFCG